MPPAADEGIPLLSPLVGRCPTLDDATRTVEYLCSQGLPRQSLAVVADVVRAGGGGYYVVSDESNARRARQLLRAGADAQAGRLGVRATPCVGSLPARSAHPSSGVTRVRLWARRSRPRSGER